MDCSFALCPLDGCFTHSLPDCSFTLSLLDCSFKVRAPSPSLAPPPVDLQSPSKMAEGGGEASWETSPGKAPSCAVHLWGAHAAARHSSTSPRSSMLLLMLRPMLWRRYARGRAGDARGHSPTLPLPPVPVSCQPGRLSLPPPPCAPLDSLFRPRTGMGPFWLPWARLGLEGGGPLLAMGSPEPHYFSPSHV